MSIICLPHCSLSGFGVISSINRVTYKWIKQCAVVVGQSIITHCCDYSLKYSLEERADVWNLESIIPALSGLQPLSSLKVPERSWAMYFSLRSGQPRLFWPASTLQGPRSHVEPEIWPTGDQHSTAAFNRGSRDCSANTSILYSTGAVKSE